MCKVKDELYRITWVLVPNFTLGPILLLATDSAAKLVHICAHGKACDSNFHYFMQTIGIILIAQDFKTHWQPPGFHACCRPLKWSNICSVCICIYTQITFAKLYHSLIFWWSFSNISLLATVCFIVLSILSNSATWSLRTPLTLLSCPLSLCNHPVWCNSVYTL